MNGGEHTEAGPMVARATSGAAGNAPSRQTTHTSTAAFDGSEAQP